MKEKRQFVSKETIRRVDGNVIYVNFPQNVEEHIKNDHQPADEKQKEHVSSFLDRILHRKEHNPYKSGNVYVFNKYRKLRKPHK